MNIIEINHGAWSARINGSLGANCISLRNSKYGAVLLREPKYEGEKLDNPYLYGMPILFPVNRIQGGSFELFGVKYEFPINEPATGCHLHGELHKAEFTLDEKEESRAVFSYTASKDKPYLSFPHAFRIIMEYSLGDGGLSHTVTAQNLSDRPMPCLLGFHTTFRLDFSGEGELLAKVGIAKEYERNMKCYLPTGVIPEPDEVTEELSRGTLSPRGKVISRHYLADGTLMTLSNVSRGLTLVYENDARYTHRLIYSGKGDEYICLEPQNCVINAPHVPLPQKERIIDIIEPGGSITYKSKIYLTEDQK
jgi:aldose 1-epimerase